MITKKENALQGCPSSPEEIKLFEERNIKNDGPSGVYIFPIHTPDQKQ